MNANTIYQKKNIWKDNRGVALVVSIVVGMVVTTFCLTLLLVSYNLFSTTIKGGAQDQCKQLAISLAQSIDEQICADKNSSLDFTSYDEQMAALMAGQDNLWFYLRYNIGQSNWPYYNVDENGHNSEKFAERYFNLTPNGTDRRVYDKATICMSWESSADTQQTGWKAEDTQLEAMLKVEIVVEFGGFSYSMNSYYSLDVSRYDESIEVGERNQGNSVVNPSGNSIYNNERWRWTKESAGVE